MASHSHKSEPSNPVTPKTTTPTTEQPSLSYKEKAIREALTLARKKGLRNFAKYPVEPWEEPLSAEEQARKESA